MNALRLLKDTNWGAEKRPLLNIYRSIIQPVIEYGMEAYFLFRNVTRPIVQSSIRSSPSMHRCYEEHPNDLPATLLWRNAIGDSPIF